VALADIHFGAMMSTPFSISLGTLADSALFFLAAVLLLTYLGLGISAIALPASLRPLSWIMAPYVGYSLLVTVSSWMTAGVACIARRFPRVSHRHIHLRPLPVLGPVISRSRNSVRLMTGSS